ncbi:MAG: catalase [Erysipelotrichaceae bacterium]|nr:catalase [Erysipelotrichaceae bacterium]
MLPWHKRFIGHLSTITTHKLLVTKFCFKVGLIRQGLLHDLSKYSPVEFFAGVKYFQGDRSPIAREKEVIGYSLGWLHHKGHNRHHLEYWIDRNRDGYFYTEIPKNIVKEMVCDRIAACMVYQKDKYTDASALEYYQLGFDYPITHPATKELLTTYLTWVKEYGLNEGLRKIKED